MKVKNLMSHDVFACGVEDTLAHAAQVMWEHDCGAVPVVDGDSQVVAMVTDRDLCMAAYTQGKRLGDIPLRSAMSRQLRACHEDDDVAAAEELMRRNQVRRLPVTAKGGRLVGIISLNDLAREAARKGGKLDRAEVVETLAAISQPHARVIRPQPVAAHA
ncbi:MAG: CBS domain-containing protein [Planctomycetota bacterium]